MRRLCLLFLVFSSSLLNSQNTVSADAVPGFHVCNDADSASQSPCATAPRLLKKVSPDYPQKDILERKQGTVTLRLIVSKSGSVGRVQVVAGVDKDMDQAAIEAVSRWRYEPAMYQGHPVDVELTALVNFELNANPPQQQIASSGNVQEQTAADDEFRNLYSNAYEAYTRGDYATSANLQRKATSIKPGNANAWNELGRSLMMMNQLEAAAEAFQTSIKCDPASRSAYTNLGMVYWRERKYEEAAAEFRKQIVVNPDDHYAHRDLGMMLRSQHRCGEAMPELEKSLSLTPNHAGALLAEGACDLDLGNRAKGVSELEQAISISSGAGFLNGAAYALASRNVEIGMAEKWSDICLSIEKLHFQNISLDHLTPEQLNYASLIANYWDTRGWIYFLQGDNSNARSYVEAAWSIRADPTIGDHLGHIYEKLGQPEDAAKAYAMAVASADQPPTGAGIDLNDLADAKGRVAVLTNGDVDGRIAKGRADLSARSVVSVANEGALSASADFAVMLRAAGKAAEFHQLNGDKALAKFANSLQAAKLPVFLPESAGVEVPVRGTLTCHPAEKLCSFAFMSPEEAVSLARNEMALASAAPVAGSARDPHVYDDAAMGMHISVPDEWKLITVDPGSFSQFRSATFAKPGSLATFSLVRGRFEGSIELYLKAVFSERTDFKRYAEESVKRDGLTGTRWKVSYEYKGIVYSAIAEVFGAEGDYYSIMTSAPTEVYARYAETFENVLHSVQFPMLGANANRLNANK